MIQNADQKSSAVATPNREISRKIKAAAYQILICFFDMIGVAEANHKKNACPLEQVGYVEV